MGFRFEESITELDANRFALQAQPTITLFYPAARAGKEVTLSMRATYR